MKKDNKVSNADKQKKEGVSQSLIERIAAEQQAVQNNKRGMR